MIENIMKLNELIVLGSLVGQKWKYLTGAALTRNQMTDAFVLVTDNQKLSFGGFVSWVEANSLAQLMCSFEVNERPASRMEEICSENLHFFHFQGETVQDVVVERECISKKVDGNIVWSYFSDVGISIRLESGSIKLFKQTHHDETLAVEFVKSNREMAPTSTLSVFNPDLFNSYESTFSTVSLRTIFAEGGN